MPASSAIPGTMPPPLVGREDELGILLDHLAAARAGRGSLVLLGGEAGIGKTALAETLCREAADQGVLILIGRCYDLTETPPYGPWLDLFGRYHATDALPALPDAFAQRGTVGAVASQAVLVQQVLAFLTTLAARQPVVLLLDDLHWADPASLDLLRLLARSLDEHALLVLATYRADELTRRHPLAALLPLLVREASAVRLDLRRLERAEMRALIAARYVLPAADVDRLAAYLDARSEGNPFFLGELLRALEEARGLMRGDAGWQLGDLARVRVPTLLRQVIDGRLARLGEETETLLEVAAIVGQEVPLVLWLATGTGNEDRLLGLIERASAARILEETPDGAGVRFTHALIREALYERIPAIRRRRLHRQIGEALVGSVHPDPDAIAAHFQRAGDERAADWLIKAGGRAQQAYAWVTAAERYEAALTRMASDEATSERGWVLYHLARMRRFADSGQSLRDMDEAIRVAAVVGDRALAAVALCDRGITRIYLGQLRQGVEELAAGADAIEALSPGERDFLLHQSHEDFSSPAQLRGTLVTHMADIGRLAEARAMGEGLLTGTMNPVPGSMERSSAYGDAWHGLGSVYALLGMPDKARHAYERSQVVYQDVGHHALRFFVYWIYLDRLSLPYHADRLPERHRIASEAEQARVQAASSGSTFPPHFAALSTLFVEGRWAEAEAIARASLAQPRPIYARFYARRILGLLARERGEPDAGWTRVRGMFPDGPDTVPGDLLYREVIPFHQLAVLLALDAGDLDIARAWLEAQETWQAWSGAILGRSEGHLCWAMYHRARGDAPQALHHAQQALALATNPRQPLALLATHRTLGTLAADAGQYDDALPHLDTALALAAACHAPFERALTILATAELHAITGKQTEAEALIEQVRAICIPLGATPTLARADALAARLAAITEASPSFPNRLSAREVEVLRLVAQGLTNAQVAERLFLSPRTINAHLTTIYTKLNVPSRAAAIRFAFDHHLA